ncbi:ParA family protein [Shewanella xiamenensis]|uniref:ParA family protein n=1 Tax=Shewanella xiamenensis TaxID=332186 RepID=A0ABT6UH01_9GAMM|nr:ParA family protein [Shewanella xiamenensis]MCR4535517.1 ParA family protein [Shewanella xiamenensis]MDI5833671.1 ParA family protein [Shewanella xiamenensis]
MDYTALIAMGARATSSRQFRSDVQKDVKNEVSKQTYSQRELHRLLKFTNKPIAMNTLKEVMLQQENEGVIFPRTASGQYQLSIEDCWKVGDYLGVTRYRDKGLNAFVAILQNLKGGVGKSLGTNMLAEALILLDKYLMQQVRVLIIDLDPQGTSTQQVLPGYEISDSDLTSVLAMASKGLTRDELLLSGVKKTSITNLDILPCGTLDGFLADELDDLDITEGQPYFTLLHHRVIQNLAKDYDFIFLDAGPHMDKVMKNCIAAADGIFIPVPPTFYNWDSTVRFVERLPIVIEQMISDGYQCDKLKFISAYISKDVSNKRQHDQDIYQGAVSELYNIFGHQFVLKHPLPAEDAFERCTDSSTTIFSMIRKNYTGSTDAFNRSYIKASEWAKELIDMMVIYHKGEQ